MENKRIQMTGVLALAVIAVAVWMAVVSRQFEAVTPAGLPGGFKGRVMALEFVARDSDVALILGPNHALNRDVMRKVTMIDFLWIICYGLLFVSIASLLAKRNCPWAKYLAWIAAVSGVSAAGFDVMENRAILEVLNSSVLTQDEINAVRDVALLKWTLSFVSMALLAIAFLSLEGKVAKWIAFAFVATATVGLAGLWSRPILGLVPIPLLLGLILLALCAFLAPEKLRENRC